MLSLIRRNRQEIIVSLIFLFFAFGFNVYRVQGDGRVYYAFLERLLHIADPETSVGMQGHGFQQSGCAFFNAPFYLLAYLIEKLLHIHFNINGITLRQISINLASNFYMTASLIMMVRLLKKMSFKFVILPVISILFSTSAFVVAVIMPSLSHAVDVFINTIFVYLFLTSGNSRFKLFLVGAVYIFAILVRYFNCVLIVILLSYWLLNREYTKFKYFLYGLIATAWIVPLIFYIYNGNALNPSFHGALVMKGLAVVTPHVPKYALKYLVHPLHGLFVWSPVTILSALGLIYSPSRTKKLGYSLLLAWGGILLIYGFFPWHAGWSFSNRYLTGLFPIFVIGLAACLERYGKTMVLLTILLTLYSVFLFFNWYLGVMHGEFGTPLNVIEAWLKGKSSSFSGGKVNGITFLRKIWQICRYKYLFR